MVAYNIIILSYVYTRVAYALCKMFQQYDWSKFILDESHKRSVDVA